MPPEAYATPRTLKQPSCLPSWRYRNSDRSPFLGLQYVSTVILFNNSPPVTTVASGFSCRMFTVTVFNRKVREHWCSTLTYVFSGEFFLALSFLFHHVNFTFFSVAVAVWCIQHIFLLENSTTLQLISYLKWPFISVFFSYINPERCLDISVLNLRNSKVLMLIL